MADLILLLIAFSVIGGAAGYFYADRTGRNKMIWCALGVTTNILFVGALYLLHANRRNGGQSR